MKTNRLVAISFGLLSLSAPASATPLRAQTFIEGIGVNAHLMYSDSSYANLDRTLTALAYLGVHNVRDSTLSPSPNAWARFAKAAEAGVKFNFFVREDDVMGAVARLHNFVQRYPKSVISIEGPNEVNNWPVQYGGKSGAEGAQAYQKALFDAVKSDPTLRDIPVYNFTTYPNARGTADFGNTHPYPKRGGQPYETMLFESQHRIMPEKPLVVTEAGYYTLPRALGWGGVDESTQAIFLANLLLDATFLKLPRTYIYQLLDAYPDRDLTKQENHFGLFDIRYQPKPAALAIRNIIQLMTDRDPRAATFPLREMNYTIRAPSSARSLLFQKTTGESIVAIWNEPPIWDDGNLRPIETDNATVTLTVPDWFGNIAIVDPLRGLTPIKRLRDVSEVRFSLNKRPIFAILTER